MSRISARAGRKSDTSIFAINKEGKLSNPAVVKELLRDTDWIDGVGESLKGNFIPYPINKLF
jgi:hypothetical protein